MNAIDIAQALKHLDWTGVPVGNKAVIQQAITAIEHASLQFPGEPIGYVSPEVAAGSKDWERETLFDTPEQANTEPVYAAPVTAAAAIAIAWSDAYAKGLNAGLHACLRKVHEYESREWAGDASGARNCMREIELLMRALPTEQDAAVSLTELAQRVIEYGDARQAGNNTVGVQTTFSAVLSALPGNVIMRDAGGRVINADVHAVRDLARRVRSAATEHEQITISDQDANALERCAGMLVEPVTEPEFTDWGRAALHWVLYHNLGSRNPIGRAIRFALGMEASQQLNATQVGEALRWAQSTNTPPARAAQACVADRSDAAAIPEPIQRDLERNDWTPEEALQWYADGKHFDTVAGRTRVLDTGAVASNALKRSDPAYHALKGAGASFPAPDAALAGERAVVAQAGVPIQSLTEHKVSLWDAFEMGFAFRSALLGHVLDGRDVGRLTTCEFWPEPMLGMHEGADLHLGLSVGEAVARLKSEVRRRLDGLDAASDGIGAAPPVAVRERICEAIDGAMAFGYLKLNEPPASHWLAPWWASGRAQRAAMNALRYLDRELTQYLDEMPADETSRKLRDTARDGLAGIDSAPFARAAGAAHSPAKAV